MFRKKEGLKKGRGLKGEGEWAREKKGWRKAPVVREKFFSREGGAASGERRGSPKGEGERGRKKTRGGIPETLKGDDGLDLTYALRWFQNSVGGQREKDLEKSRWKGGKSIRRTGLTCHRVGLKKKNQDEIGEFRGE